MRVIKFRGWNGKEIIQDIFNVKVNPESEHQGISIPKQCVFSLSMSSVQDVMQFTGLLDKNGAEIYEGDICVWYINDIERVGEIYYHSQSFEMRSPSMGYIGWDANRGEIEVIGNIHETPELLK